MASADAIDTTAEGPRLALSAKCAAKTLEVAPPGDLAPVTRMEPIDKSRPTDRQGDVEGITLGGGRGLEFYTTLVYNY